MLGSRSNPELRAHPGAAVGSKRPLNATQKARLREAQALPLLGEAARASKRAAAPPTAKPLGGGAVGTVRVAARGGGREPGAAWKKPARGRAAPARRMQQQHNDVATPWLGTALPPPVSITTSPGRLRDMGLQAAGRRGGSKGKAVSPARSRSGSPSRNPARSSPSVSRGPSGAPTPDSHSGPGDSRNPTPSQSAASVAVGDSGAGEDSNRAPSATSARTSDSVTPMPSTAGGRRHEHLLPTEQYGGDCVAQAHSSRAGAVGGSEVSIAELAARLDMLPKVPRGRQRGGVPRSVGGASVGARSSPAAITASASAAVQRAERGKSMQNDCRSGDDDFARALASGNASAADSLGSLSESPSAPAAVSRVAPSDAIFKGKKLMKGRLTDVSFMLDAANRRPAGGHPAEEDGAELLSVYRDVNCDVAADSASTAAKSAVELLSLASPSAKHSVATAPARAIDLKNVDASIRRRRLDRLKEKHSTAGFQWDSAVRRGRQSTDPSADDGHASRHLPAGRVDAARLERWVSREEQHLPATAALLPGADEGAKHGLAEDDFKEALEMYNTAMSRFVDQESSTCAERASLVSHLWEGLTTLLTQRFQQAMGERDRAKNIAEHCRAEADKLEITHEAIKQRLEAAVQEAVTKAEGLSKRLKHQVKLYAKMTELQEQKAPRLHELQDQVEKSELVCKRLLDRCKWQDEEIAKEIKKQDELQNKLDESAEVQAANDATIAQLSSEVLELKRQLAEAHKKIQIVKSETAVSQREAAAEIASTARRRRRSSVTEWSGPVRRHSCVVKMADVGVQFNYAEVKRRQKKVAAGAMLRMKMRGRTTFLHLPLMWRNLLKQAKSNSHQARDWGRPRLVKFILDQFIGYELSRHSTGISAAMGEPANSGPAVPFHDWVLAGVSKKFGVRRLVELQLQELLESVMSNSDVSRLCVLFGRACELWNSLPPEAMDAMLVTWHSVVSRLASRHLRLFVAGDESLWIPKRVASHAIGVALPKAFSRAGQLALSALDECESKTLDELRDECSLSLSNPVGKGERGAEIDLEGSHACYNVEDVLHCVVQGSELALRDRDESNWKAVFDQVDVDDSGALDEEEFVRLVSSVELVNGKDATEAKLRRLFMQAMAAEPAAVRDIGVMSWDLFFRTVSSVGLRFKGTNEIVSHGADEAMPPALSQKSGAGGAGGAVEEMRRKAAELEEKNTEALRHDLLRQSAGERLDDIKERWLETRADVEMLATQSKFLNWGMRALFHDRMVQVDSLLDHLSEAVFSSGAEAKTEEQMQSAWEELKKLLAAVDRARRMQRENAVCFVQAVVRRHLKERRAETERLEKELADDSDG